MIDFIQIENIEKELKKGETKSLHVHANDLVDITKKSLLFDGILGNLKKVLESTCSRYGAEELGNRCCFKYMYGREYPCIACSTRSNLGYPCPACSKVHRNT